MRPSHKDSQGLYDSLTVGQPQPLLEFLVENGGKSRNKIKATLQGRGVRVDGKVVTQFDYPLKPGMKVSISRNKRGDTFRNRFVKIVYEDRHIIVIEKAVGILSVALGKNSLNVKSILNDYLSKTRQRCTAHAVHRLDRDTSGLMMYAKDMDTARVLELNWHRIVYDRRYVAVVSGEVGPDYGTISSWLRDTSACVVVSSPVDNGGKFAVTHYRTLARTTEHSLVEFRLETGRKNQIRVHSADMGHPVCGDDKYGNGDDPLRRLCLHAHVLCFTHPVTGERMEFDTVVPAGFRRMFK